jgi:hypothetical protein
MSIHTIDWKKLAQLYNEKHSKQVSFEGSSASLYYDYGDYIVITFTMIATHAERSVNKFEQTKTLFRDKKTGKLYSLWEKSCEPPPPDKHSITLGSSYFCIILFLITLSHSFY